MTETVAATEPHIYKVPDCNLAYLREQLAKLQKKAQKLGCAPIQLIEVGYEDWPGYYAGEFKVSYCPAERIPAAIFGQSVVLTGSYRRYHLVRVEGTAPKIAGWKFAATIDQVSDESGAFVGNLLRAVEGMEIPIGYRDGDAKCDHCQTQRRRRNTFVLQHEDGHWAQVGRQCLRDFLGHESPESYARIAELILEFSDLCGMAEDDDMLGDSYGIQRFASLDMLTHCACLVRTDGWKSRAKYGEQATAAYLQAWVHARNKEAEDFARNYQISDDDKQTGLDTLNWLKSLSEREDLNDYLYNLSLIGKAGLIEPKMFGLLASAVPAYLRTKDIETSRLREREESKWVGQPKARIEAVLTLLSTRVMESFYGVRVLCRFRDEHGNIIVWWASSEVDLKPGTQVRAKFTVKAHSEYREVKQTIVLRLKVEEVVSTATPATPEELPVAEVPVEIA